MKRLFAALGALALASVGVLAQTNYLADNGIFTNLFNISNTWGALQAFNGGATASTQAAGDSSTNLATTAFVANALSGTTKSLNAAGALAVTDCQNSVSLDGAAFYTLTASSVASFPTGCRISVFNTDASRGKNISISGLTFNNGNILWPQQSFTIFNSGSAWVVLNDPGIWQLPTTTTFNVDPVNGNNSNDCLAPGTGACLTVAGALAYVCNNIDAMGHRTIIQLADDLTHYTTQINACEVKGAGDTSFTSTPVIRGNVATPANVVINTTSSSGFVSVNVHTAWRLEGITWKVTTGGQAVVADVGSIVYIGNNDFQVGSCCNVFQALNSGFIEIVSNFSISANANVVLYANNGGRYVFQPVTVTLNSSPVWAFAFAYVFSNASVYMPGVTFGGTGATGNRCNLILAGGVDTNGGGATYLPGNVACSGGAIVSPGWYN